MSPPGLTGFSRGLYSNWLLHQPFQLLIDAGEGLSLALGTNVFSIGVIAITHGHSDHLLGLPGVVGARRFGKGAQEKPYTVIYPSGSNGVESMRKFISDSWRGVDFPIAWTPLTAGESIRLTAKRSIEAFAVSHVDYEPSFGYRVVEARRRLKADLSTLPQSEIERIARQRGREDVMEEYSHVVFAHSGDAMPIDVAVTRNADILVHDATFLEPGDRREPIHASSREVFALARESNVRTLVLNHLSIRYERSAALIALREQRIASGFTGETWLLDEGTFVNLQ